MAAIQQILIGAKAAPAVTYTTWDPVNKGTNCTLSNGNLTATSTDTNSNAFSLITKSSGKWYWEVTLGTNAAVGRLVGLSSLNNYSGSLGATGTTYSYYTSTGAKYGPSGSYVAYGAFCANGDIIGVALDMDAGTCTFYKNGVSQGTAFTGLTGSLYAAVGGDYGAAGTIDTTTNFGATAFSYSPPGGFNSGLYV